MLWNPIHLCKAGAYGEVPSCLEQGGKMKKLADMNLVDDFLAYSLTAHRRYGEEASRYILECIL